jgi:hypothetical protein
MELDCPTAPVQVTVCSLSRDERYSVGSTQDHAITGKLEQQCYCAYGLSRYRSSRVENLLILCTLSYEAYRWRAARLEIHIWHSLPQTAVRRSSLAEIPSVDA